MKKTIILALALCMSMAAAGCAKTDTAEETTKAEETISEKAETAVPEEDTEETEADEPAGAVMSYDEYMAAELDTEVTVETYVQAKQSWKEEKTTVYSQDQDGAYFIYNMACSEEDYEKLVPSTKIRVTGYKSEWAGEVEIMDAVFEFVDGEQFAAEPVDITELLGSDELINYQNQLVTFKGMTVEAAGQDSDGNDVAFLYNWDGSGTDGDDLYFNASVNGETYTFTVESALCDNATDVYEAVKTLKIGQVIDMEGFLYWYEGVNPHITSVTVAE